MIVNEEHLEDIEEMSESMGCNLRDWNTSDKFRFDTSLSNDFILIYPVGGSFDEEEGGFDQEITYYFPEIGKILIDVNFTEASECTFDHEDYTTQAAADKLIELGFILANPSTRTTGK